jgi:4-hydroxy-2-oxoglutarate aldolase
MPLPAGIYCPVVTFFQPTPAQELDLPANVRHIQFLGRAGVEGVVVQGSTAEAVALSREEKITVSLEPLLSCKSVDWDATRVLTI